MPFISRLHHVLQCRESIIYTVVKAPGELHRAAETGLRLTYQRRVWADTAEPTAIPSPVRALWVPCRSRSSAADRLGTSNCPSQDFVGFGC
jgi:hypothetical protein